MTAEIKKAPETVESKNEQRADLVGGNAILNQDINLAQNGVKSRVDDFSQKHHPDIVNPALASDEVESADVLRAKDIEAANKAKQDTQKETSVALGALGAEVGGSVPAAADPGNTEMMAGFGAGDEAEKANVFFSDNKDNASGNSVTGPSDMINMA